MSENRRPLGGFFELYTMYVYNARHIVWFTAILHVHVRCAQHHFYLIQFQLNRLSFPELFHIGGVVQKSTYVFYTVQVF